MQRMNKSDCLNLSPIINDYIKYQLLEQNEKKEKYKIKSGMNFITWLWGSGKTFFIEKTLEYFKDFLWEKELIRIDFSPRNLETTGSIYSHFLDTFISELLSKKYDPNLKGYKSNLLRVLGSETGNTYLDIFFKFFNSSSENVQDILKRINHSLQTTYKDFFVIVIIDDIDRVEKKDLLNIGKILNLLKNLTDIQKEDTNTPEPNLISFYSADSNYLNNFYLWDSDNQQEKGVNFYQYFNKFRDTQIDVYDATYENLITFLQNSILAINSNEETEEKLYLCNRLFDALKEKDIPVTIRDLLFLKKEILEKFEQNIDKAKGEFGAYSDIIPHKQFESYFYFWSERINIFLLYLYIKSIYEKDSQILSDLDTVISKREESTNKNEIVKKIKKENTFVFNDIAFWSDQDDNYDLTKHLIKNQNSADFFKRHVLNCWTKFITEEIKKPNFKNIENFQQIVNRLFPSFHDRWSIFIMDSISKSIFHNIDEDSWEMLNIFLENYIQIITEYLKNISKYQRNDLSHIRDWHLDKICHFFSEFTNKEWSLLRNIYNKNSDFPKQWLDAIESFFKEIKSNNDTRYQFIFLYLILLLNTFSKETNPIIERFPASTIIQDTPDFIWNLTRDFLNILPKSSNSKKEQQRELITAWRNILYRLISYPESKELPLLKLFGEEATLLILIYSITNILQDWRKAFEANQDIKEKKYYKKIYQELLESHQWGDIKTLIEKYKDKILIRYETRDFPQRNIEVDFLSNLEGNISIEDISDYLKSFYWENSN